MPYRMTLPPARLIVVSLLAVAVCAACSTRETTLRRPGEIEGIDVSHHQRTIDWPAVVGDGIDFAFMKATEGATHVDTEFCSNWASAASMRLPRGAYHFFRPGTDADAQFDHFRELVELSPGDLPPVLDVEVLDGVSEAQLIEGLRTWVYLAEITYGVKPVIYTNLKFYYHHLAGHFDEYPLWIARYDETSPSLSTAAEVTFWQHGDRGRVAGVTGAVDLNVFVGGREAFESLRIAKPAKRTTAQVGDGLRQPF